MAQRVFGTVGAAADDVAAVFGEEASDLSAAFLVWALQETERCFLVFSNRFCCFVLLLPLALFPFGGGLRSVGRLPCQGAAGDRAVRFPAHSNWLFTLS